jgi:hypothetical protein
MKICVLFLLRPEMSWRLRRLRAGADSCDRYRPIRLRLRMLELDRLRTLLDVPGRAGTTREGRWGTIMMIVVGGSGSAMTRPSSVTFASVGPSPAAC